MSLKKNLKIKKAQTIVEYYLLFILFAFGIVAVFGGFNPESVNIKQVFQNQIEQALSTINSQR